MTTNPALLHVYAQDWPHNPAFVVGNRAGLEALREAIDCALSRELGVGATPPSPLPECICTADGECYHVYVCRLDQPWQGEEWQQLKLPYTDGLDHGPKSIGPDMLIEQRGTRVE